MNCPTCGIEMEKREGIFLTSVKPKESFRCPSCRRTLLVFDVIGEADISVWKDEIPNGYSFSDFMRDKLEERNRTILN